MPPQIRVLCVDDHAIVSEGIALIIGKQPDMTVAATATSGQEAVRLFQLHKPEVTLMDLRLGSMSGIAAIRAIRQIDPNARIVVLTMYEGDEDIARALEAGAAAYLLKTTVAESLVHIIRDVHAGVVPALSPDLQKRLNERMGYRALTKRERQVLELLARGLRNKEIAMVCLISAETVEIHVRHILDKLNARDRRDAVRIGARRGLIQG